MVTFGDIPVPGPKCDEGDDEDDICGAPVLKKEFGEWGDAGERGGEASEDSENGWEWLRPCRFADGEGL